MHQIIEGEEKKGKMIMKNPFFQRAYHGNDN